MMVPINVNDDHLTILANTFGCSIGSLPFTYLGLPLSLTEPTVADYWPLVSKCERRMVSISSFLSQAGRLQMTNAMLTALPTFSMCTFLFPKTVIKQIDKFGKHCLWRGSDVNSKKPSKAAWKLVCDSDENGGLGVLNLQTQNESLLLKHLHKFFNKVDTLGFSWFGISTMSMVSNLFITGKAHFRGGIYLNYWTLSKKWLQSQLQMALLASFGLMCGMVDWLVNNF
jgi:hypothetical protein